MKTLKQIEYLRLLSWSCLFHPNELMKIIKEKEDECVYVCFFETLTTRETTKPKETLSWDDGAKTKARLVLCSWRNTYC